MLIRVDKHSFMQDQTWIVSDGTPSPFLSPQRSAVLCWGTFLLWALCWGLHVSAQYLGEPVGSLEGSWNVLSWKGPTRAIQPSSALHRHPNNSSQVRRGGSFCAPCRAELMARGHLEVLAQLAPLSRCRFGQNTPGCLRTGSGSSSLLQESPAVYTSCLVPSEEAHIKRVDPSASAWKCLFSPAGADTPCLALLWDRAPHLPCTAEPPAPTMLGPAGSLTQPSFPGGSVSSLRRRMGWILQDSREGFPCLSLRGSLSVRQACCSWLAALCSCAVGHD